MKSFLLAAAVCARRGIRTIAIGTLRGNPFPDATDGFYRAFATLARRALHNFVTIVSKLCNLPLQPMFSWSNLHRSFQPTTP